MPVGLYNISMTVLGSDNPVLRESHLDCVIYISSWLPCFARISFGLYNILLTII